MPVTNNPPVGEKAPSVLEKGPFVVALLSRLESAGHRVVYLRNYENLPDDIGNDVDLLVERGHSYCILKIIKAFAPAWGWTIWKTVPSSCLSVYFLYDNKRGALHIDLFEHLEWHCVPFANAKGVLERRVWTGLVFKPSVPDELLVNLSVRLIYHGIVRDKHRVQWRESLSKENQEVLQDLLAQSFGRHQAMQLYLSASQGDWNSIEKGFRSLRRAILFRAMLKSPSVLVVRYLVYLLRGVRRLLHPSGLFIVFEGDRFPWRETVAKHAVTEIETIYCFKKCLDFQSQQWFHRFLCLNSNNTPSSKNASDRGSRGRVRPLLLLGGQCVVFWWKYIRHWRAHLACNELVASDGYAIDAVRSLRKIYPLLPRWACRTFFRAIPRPDVVITFVLPTNPGEAGQCELLGDHSLFVESELKCAPKIALRVTQENEVQLADEALRLLQAEPNFLLEENNWRC